MAKQCRECGTYLSDDAVFCTNCGNKLVDDFLYSKPYKNSSYINKKSYNKSKQVYPTNNSRKKIIFISLFLTLMILLILAVLLNYSSENQETIYLYPTDDTTIHQNSATTNGGLSETMTLRNEYGASYGWSRDILIKFDLSPIGSDKTVNSAKLKLYYYKNKDNSPVNNTLCVYKIISDWEENSVTWNTKPQNESNCIAYCFVPALIENWIEWDVTSEIEKISKDESPNYGWRISDETYWGSYNIPITYFYSKESTNYVPYLEIKVNNNPFIFCIILLLIILLILLPIIYFITNKNSIK
jgi:hypothetical protein